MITSARPPCVPLTSAMALNWIIIQLRFRILALIILAPIIPVRPPRKIAMSPVAGLNAKAIIVPRRNAIQITDKHIYKLAPPLATPAPVLVRPGRGIHLVSNRMTLVVMWSVGWPVKTATLPIIFANAIPAIFPMAAAAAWLLPAAPLRQPRPPICNALPAPPKPPFL